LLIHQCINRKLRSKRKERCVQPNRKVSPESPGISQEIRCDVIALDERLAQAQNQSVKTFPLFLCLAFSGMSAVSALAEESPTPDPALYGPYPKLYKEIIWNWMQKNLVDAGSAKIEWEGEPKPADLGKNGEHLYGWLVDFKVNSRNRFGAYTGKQSHGALIRNGEVIKGIGFGY
jgi:hypothetical protein